MFIDENKRELRRRFRAIRKELGAERRAELDEAIEARLLALPEYTQAQVLLAYLDFGPEVRTRGIIQAAWAAGKVVALPWCVPGTRDMRWFVVRSFEGLVKSKLGVEEPVPDPSYELFPQTERRSVLALVPGLAFDAQGFRMGYGGGFYDTFLAGFAGTSAGLCREVQLADDLGALGVLDDHDLPADLVVTNERVMRKDAG